MTYLRKMPHYGVAVVEEPSVRSKKEVARWVLSSAPYIAVEEPTEPRGMVHDWAKQMVVELNN